MMRSLRSRALVSAAALAATIVTACDSPTSPDTRYRIPVQTDDGWQTASLESVGMEVGPLEEVLQLIADTDHHLYHGMLIVRHNRLVFEHYWAGEEMDLATLDLVPKEFNRDSLHYVASVSKSLTSALLGIAMERTGTGSVEDSLFAHFPAYRDLMSQDNAGILVKHLLGFSSGLEWNEFVYGFDDPRDSHYQMFAAADPIHYLLARPVTFTPGSQFNYNSGDTNLVGEIVRTMTGATALDAFADTVLFGPLGITTYRWTRIGNVPNLVFASGGAWLRPRDMAKFGTMYLDGGIWNGVQVVPAAWVAASTTMATPLPSEYGATYGYGYNWWLGRSEFRGSTVDYFRALGWGGQEIFVYPELDLVLVFTSGAYYDARTPPLHTVLDYILEAVVD